MRDDFPAWDILDFLEMLPPLSGRGGAICVLHSLGGGF